MKVKCPCCGQVFDSIEHPEPVIGKESQHCQPQKFTCKSISYATSSVGEERMGSRLFAHHNIGGTLSQPSTQTALPVGAMKKGYDEILDVLDKRGGANWKTLEEETSLSTATLSKRLKEGKKAGIIGKKEEIYYRK